MMRIKSACGAHFGHHLMPAQSPLSKVKEKSDLGAVRSPFDPTETLVPSNDSALHAGFRPSETTVLATRA